MAEAMLARFTRVLGTGIRRDRAEPAQAEFLPRHAEQELELAEQAVRKARAEARSRRLGAGRARDKLIAQLADLDAHAQFAVERALDELARDVRTLQVDLEAELLRLADDQAAAEAEARAADEVLIELQARRLALIAPRPSDLSQAA